MAATKKGTQWPSETQKSKGDFSIRPEKASFQRKTIWVPAEFGPAQQQLWKKQNGTDSAANFSGRIEMLVFEDTNKPCYQSHLGVDAATIIGCDMGEKTTVEFTSSEGVQYRSKPNGLQMFHRDKVSALQSDRDKEVNKDGDVISARQNLQEAKEAWWMGPQILTVDVMGGVEYGSDGLTEQQKLDQMMDDTLEQVAAFIVEETILSESVKIYQSKLDDAISLATVKVNEARRKQQIQDKDRLAAEKLRRIRQHHHGRYSQLTFVPRSYDEEILFHRTRMKEEVEMTNLAIRRFFATIEVVVLPKYQAKGKNSFLKTADLWNKAVKDRIKRGGVVVNQSEDFTTVLCPLDGTYSPPGRSRNFCCNNPSCSFRSRRDTKSGLLVLNSSVTSSVMELETVSSNENIVPNIRSLPRQGSAGGELLSSES